MRITFLMFIFFRGLHDAVKEATYQKSNLTLVSAVAKKSNLTLSGAIAFFVVKWTFPTKFVKLKLKNNYNYDSIIVSS